MPDAMGSTASIKELESRRVGIRSDVSRAYLRHSIRTVYPLARAAISAVWLGESDRVVRYGMLCASRNARAVPALMAKFIGRCRVSP